ncbi:MAG: Do family serine endopeptidase [Flavobacteriales bacterium]|nr:Do family serine endopeptidase [Flavobacteriales bacterium]MCX7768982.1 Do family serine endopeptidase [Flavobacteriales bacterium]MDW8410271.1 Do family serine endopeptidase [Flavobacteriales bacterium]
MKTRQVITHLLVGVFSSLTTVLALRVSNLWDNQKEITPRAGLVSPPLPARAVAYDSTAPETGIDFTTAAEKTVNAVVHIRTVETVRGTRYSYDPFRDFFFGNPFVQPQPIVGTGSGVIISEDGYIVTNNHVVDGASTIDVTLNNKKTFRASIVGTDPSTDLALLKIDAKGLPFIKFANSDEVKVGEWVLAVGNPFNLNSTVTAGIISAKARRIDIIHKDLAIESFLQTDAAVNPGNSGGALVNVHGELVGINTAIASNTGSYAGYSFAIPSNLVRKVVNDLAEFGRVQRAFLGVMLKDITHELAQEKNITDLNGVYVDNLVPGGAAEDAGIRRGDIIRKVGQVPVNSFSALQEQIALYRPGDRVIVTISRGDQTLEIPVILKNKDNQTTLLRRSDDLINLLGAQLEEFTNSYGNISGLRVVSLSSGKLKAVGVKPGFLITKVNGKPVRTINDLADILAASDGSVYIEGIYPNGEKAYYAFGI